MTPTPRPVDPVLGEEQRCWWPPLPLPKLHFLPCDRYHQQSEKKNLPPSSAFLPSQHHSHKTCQVCSAHENSVSKTHCSSCPRTEHIRSTPRDEESRGTKNLFFSHLAQVVSSHADHFDFMCGGFETAFSDNYAALSQCNRSGWNWFHVFPETMLLGIIHRPRCCFRFVCSLSCISLHFNICFLLLGLSLSINCLPVFKRRNLIIFRWHSPMALLKFSISTSVFLISDE